MTMTFIRSVPGSKSQRTSMTRPEVIATIVEVRNACARAGMDTEALALHRVIDAFAIMELTAAQILGSKGGKTPVKPGSRPRGRPRKEK